MRINIIYQFFQSEDEPGHSLTYNLANRLAEKGEEITVFCGETGYMKPIAPTLPFWKRLIQKSKIDQVDIYRTYSYVSLHSNTFARLLNYLTFCLSSSLALFFTKKPDVALISSPPLFSAFTSCFVYWLRRVPCIVEVRDLWPDSLIQMKVLNNRFAIGLMYWMEKFIYNHAKGIIVLTKGIRKDLLRRGWDKQKIFFVHCGVDFKKLYPDPLAGKKIRHKYGWEDKKVFMYFGALGEANNLDVIIRAAKSLKDRKEILFVLVGDGINKDKIKAEAIDSGLTNLEIISAVSKTKARCFINAADACVVTLLDMPIFAGAIPTKLIDYMACGRPVLCGVQGEAKDIVEQADCGFTFEPNDDELLSAHISNIAKDASGYLSMGLRGYAYAKKYYSIETMQKKMEDILFETKKQT